MDEKKHRVAIIGCGRLGQQYATAYSTYPDTEIVAIAEVDEDRRKAVGGRFGVKALYPDAHALLKDIVPDIAVVVTPTKYMKEAVIACAEAGAKGVSTDKPMAAVLADADEMVEACESRGIVFASGNVMRARHELQEATMRLRAGKYGELIGAALHGFRGQISGGGCQHISILRLLTDAEVDEVMAWGEPPEALDQDNDVGLAINGYFHMDSGLECHVFGMEATNHIMVSAWTEDTLIRASYEPPEIFRGYDERGARVRIDPHYQPYKWSQFRYLTGSIRSFLAAVETGSRPWITGHDLRQALEVAIASRLSAQLGGAPVKLPLKDRSLTLYPSPHRWLGYDAMDDPQTPEEAATPWSGYQ